MKVFMLLTVVTFMGFIATAIITNNYWMSFIGAAAAQLLTASIIWKVDFGTWNPFS